MKTLGKSFIHIQSGREQGNEIFDYTIQKSTWFRNDEVFLRISTVWYAIKILNLIYLMGNTSPLRREENYDVYSLCLLRCARVCID